MRKKNLTRRKKDKLLPMKKVCSMVLENLNRIRNQAKTYNITVEASAPKCCKGNVQTVHVMFNDRSGKRILNYWPGTGTWMTWYGKKGKTSDIESALAIAIAYTDHVSDQDAKDIIALNSGA